MARGVTILEAGDVLVVGAGVAGLFTALRLQRPATVLSPGPLGVGVSSAWAQGGIAAALGAGDSPDLHAADTIAAGAGIVDAKIAHILSREGPARISDLAALGVPFDRSPDGSYALGLEAAHSRRRIARITGDGSGAGIMASLVAAAHSAPHLRVTAGLVAFELARQEGRVVGVYAHPVNDLSQTVLVRAAATIFALGGVGGLYEVTTNPVQARGQGVGIAARAGAVIADPEFVQFHPTAIDVGRDPAPLVTEALRGAGALLVNRDGHPFMAGHHAAGELAPRDIVARAIFREIRAGRGAFLDARGVPDLPSAFPTVFGTCMAAGVDPRVDLIPVAPAAHYHMGGIAADEHARTSLPGLWAIGECASTGAHGANRLASNSLLEALVFGARAADDVSGTTAAPGPASEPSSEAPRRCTPAALAALRHAMTMNVGIERTDSGLREALELIERLGNEGDVDGNTAAAATLITAGALARRESRGAHYRSDFPCLSQAWARRTFVTLRPRKDAAAPAVAGPARTSAAAS